MKFFIASDIHGSSYYCEKMINAFLKSKAEKMIILGDILYHGPRNDLPKDYAPKKVIEMLNPLKTKILCVKGNCDTQVDQMVLDFPILADYGILHSGNQLIYLTHGDHINDIPFNKNDIVLAGHTHIPAAEKRNNYIYVNPGSISIPKENSPHSFIIFENGIFSFYNLENNDIYKTFNI